MIDFAWDEKTGLPVLPIDYFWRVTRRCAKSNKSVEVFELPNGRSVVCVTFGENGIDCDWEGWKQ